MNEKKPIKDNSYLEEMQRQGFKFRLVKLICVFVVLCFIVIMGSNTTKETTNEVEPIITMNELGGTSSYVKKSILMKEYGQYDLYISETQFDHSGNTWYSITAYMLNDTKEAQQKYKSIIEEKKDIEIEYAKNCLECRYYTNKDEDVLDYMISLDGQLLDVDQIHVVYDWNAVPSDGLNTNCLFLQKDNYVIRIEFKTVTVLDDQTLKLFVELFDRLPALFM
ncbi:MAG: hypothetical protein IKU28_04245 [Erysipelotrichaceae bacterium]|nr:hypothetical protein [Erysipelotrichaceae bacterium]